MKFTQISYRRPDIDKLRNDYNDLNEAFNKAATFAGQADIMKQINALRTEYVTLGTIASIKYSIDTTNKSFEEEQNFFDRNNPVYEGLVNKYYASLINSRFRRELENQWGKQLFNSAEQIVKTYKPEIMDDLKTENELKTEYTKLLASANIMFDGEARNLAGLAPYMELPDRSVRKNANEAKWEFFSQNGKEFDRIFDDLVKVRDRMAKKIGYKNFIGMGYARMERTDYDPQMVGAFRSEVEKYIVPITLKLREKQSERLGLDGLKYYDYMIDYKDGNAKPHGNPDWIIGCAKNMYEELSPQTGEFFNFMIENELMDLVTRQGKDTGGYCTFLEKYKSPFIFSNFNGTMGDVLVLTHEAGHAFQAYSSRFFEIPEYLWPTAEACEIHSMSMEFLTWPWMECFFKQQTEKFKYSHLKESLMFIPYGVTVDEFQHYIYENPGASSSERKKAWRQIEKKYLPYYDYDGNKFLEEGGRWQQQRHIYLHPFYYIDYCLAQICAFQFWKKSQENGKAVQDYLKLCKAGGSKSFLELVSLANLKSPFDKDCIGSFVGSVEDWLQSVEGRVLN